MNNIPNLSQDRLSCEIDGVTLKCDQNIDYKSATEKRTSMGKILRFMHSGWQQEDKSSVWMLVKDIQESTTEWVSVYVWKCQYDKGIFTNKIKADKHGSEESPALEGRPF